MIDRVPHVRALRWARVVIAGLVLLGSTLNLPVRAQAADTPTAPPDGASVQVVAEGPFGRVAGIGLAADAELPDPGTLEPLDAYGRGARITFSVPAGTFDAWRVTATPQTPGSSATVLDLGSGVDAATIRVELPVTGLFLVRLDGTLSDPATPDSPVNGSWAWLIAVPDRQMSDDGPPPPAILLASGEQVVPLDQGSGCFVGTCGDIGATSPPRTLPTISTLAGAPLTVRLSDDSGIDAWIVDATPVGGTDDQTVVLATGSGDPPHTAITFAAPAGGRWVILVHVRFDRERGSFDGYGRLILEPTDEVGATAP